MSTGKLIYIITMGWTLIITGGITYLIKVKKDYTFLSGFFNRPEEEKQYLEASGYLNKIGNILAISFFIFLVTFILGLLPIPYAFEVGITFFTLYIMVALFWVQRYEVPHKRKKMMWILGSVFSATIIFVGGIFVLGLIDNKVLIENDTFEVKGMYGFEWEITEIERVELLDEMPEVIFKTNGFAMTNMLKGKFKLEEPYGNGLLFIDGREGPFLAIFTADEYVIISKKEAEETLGIYEALIEEIE